MPRLTSDDMPGGAVGRIEQVTYVIDVTSLPATDDHLPNVDLSDLSLP
ncbi:hypothetical protein [Streptomyces sp. NPDC056337]